MTHLKAAATALLALGFSWAGSASDYLGSLSEWDRGNAEVSLEVRKGQSQAAEAEKAWNSGEYERALALLRDLELQEPVNLGVSWKEPIPIANEKWGTDVQATRSGLSVASVELVRASTGNLFVLSMGYDGPDTVWTLNISTDGGQSWAETFRWNLSNGYNLYDVSAAEYSDYVYVLYSSNFVPKMFLRRFSGADGSSDAGFGFVQVDSAADFVEVALEPNLASGGQFYAAGISGGQVRFLYSNDDGLTWSSLNIPVSNAAGGLDLDYGWMSSGHVLWASWVNASGALAAAGIGGSSWDVYDNLGPAYSSYPSASVAQRGDTVLVATTYEVSGDHLYVRYYITYDDGNTWSPGSPVGTTDSTNHPSVTARGGEGWQMAYTEFHLNGPEVVKYTRRAYQGPGGWDAPQAVSQHDGWRWISPSIEYLGSAGEFGVVYVDDDFIGWFNRITWSQVAEGAKPSSPELLAALTPGGASLRFTLPAEGFVSLKVYDARGSVVRDLSGKYKEGLNEVSVSIGKKGTYFAVMRFNGQTSRAKILVIR